MFVLAIDTSTPAVTAGVVTMDLPDRAPARLALVAERAPLAARGHGELLTPAIGDCLHDAGLRPADIGAVVAGVGPGPYTGLRVGLVTAAAFADAVGAPTFAVCSLDAIAAGSQHDGELLVVTDARRREVYWARYDEHNRRLDGPHVDRPDDVPLDGVTHLAGAGAELYADVWPTVERLPVRYPDPVGLAAEAVYAMQASARSQPLTPLYLRRPDAVVPGAPKTVTQ